MEEQLQLSHGVKMSLESEVEKLNAELKQARDHMNKMSTDIREYVQKIDQYENQVILLQFQVGKILIFLPHNYAIFAHLSII